MNKIFDDDAVVPYRNTKIKALQTKSEIDGLLARWGIKKFGWDWDFDVTRSGKDVVAVHFQFSEEMDGKTITPMITLEPPRIWKKANPRQKVKETVNWDVSMRVLWWWMKSHLEYAYLSQSAKTTEFLSYVQVPGLEGKSRNLIEELLDKHNMFKALPMRENGENV